MGAGGSGLATNSTLRMSGCLTSSNLKLGKYTASKICSSTEQITAQTSVLSLAPILPVGDCFTAEFKTKRSLKESSKIAKEKIIH